MINQNTESADGAVAWALELTGIYAETKIKQTKKKKHKKNNA